MKRQPSSWSLLFAAPRSEARIFRRSSRASTPRPLEGASETEVDALLARLDATVVDPLPGHEAFARHPPRARHERPLAKVIVSKDAVVPKPTAGLERSQTKAPSRKSREALDVTVVTPRRARRALLLPPRASGVGRVPSVGRRAGRWPWCCRTHAPLLGAFLAIVVALLALAGSLTFLAERGR